MGEGLAWRFAQLMALLIVWVSLPAMIGTARDCAEPTAHIGEAAADQLTQQLAESQGRKRIELLIRRGEAYRAMGHYADATADFQKALKNARASVNGTLEILAEQSLGYVYFLNGNPEQGEILLRAAFKKATTGNRPLLSASCANRLGIIMFSQERREQALDLYERALNYARLANDAGLTTAIYLNLARAHNRSGSTRKTLQRAREVADTVLSTHERARLLIDIAVETQQFWTEDTGVSFAHNALADAFSLGENIASDRIISLAAGYLGGLYEHRGLFEKAQHITEQALAAAQRLDAHELLLQWEWQLAGILRALGSAEKAIAAGRRAVFHIQAVRRDIPIRFQDGRSSFRETLSPIYFGLAGMLLKQAGEENDNDVRQNLLHEAMAVVEQIKRSEIRDYFNDPCVDARSRRVVSLSPGAAVLYPIILKDRLELVLDAGGRLYRQVTLVSEKELNQTVNLLARILRTPHRLQTTDPKGPNRGQMIRLDARLSDASWETPAHKIFEWLIRPVLSILEKHRVNIIVYAPDGALRLLPLAALWDGKHFLIERYAVAVVPGLTILDSNPLPRAQLHAIIAGLSEPGPAVLKLPRSLLNMLSRRTSGVMNRGLSDPIMAASESESADNPEQSVPQRRETMSRVKKALALPGVEKEIQRVAQTLQAHVLVNEKFRLEDFSQNFQQNDYQIVHIASHGFFRAAPDQSFIMTYDQLLGMDQLEALIKPRQLSARPVELISLSACQTAEGDDRTPLGLTGVALKSGARSAMGSLWPVSDTAAQQLFTAFYINLKNPQYTKAMALRNAQLDLMKRDRFRHPFFWSPFILVGNWL